MNKIIFPACFTSSITDLSLSSNSPLYFAPAIIELISKATTLLFKSDVVFTPLLPDGKIDASAVTAIIKEQYKKAGVTPDELKCGAVIVTGESACRENASEVISSVSEFAGDFIAAQAGSELESYLSGKGAGADVISENEGKCTANVDKIGRAHV